MKPFKLFDEKQTISIECCELLLDKGIVSRFKTIQQYCAYKKFKFDLDEHKQLIRKVEQAIYKQVFYYAHLMYHYMEISDDWGESGKQQVQVSFCRNLLKIDPIEQLTSENFSTFSTTVNHNIKKLGIDTISKETALSNLKDHRFSLLGKQFELFKTSEFNKILTFIGSKKFLHAGQYGKQMEFIMGSGKQTSIEGYDIIHVSKEYIRTPNNIVSMAAIIGHQNIYIRIESLKTIFMQKWVQMFDYSEFDMISIYADPFWNIAEGIKQRVLDMYNIESKDSLLAIKSQFLSDMSETILHHELGHGIVHHDIIPFEIGAIGEATKIFGENIYTGILEFLADFSPRKNNLMGPIQNMIAISKTDRNRAKALYYMYMSDTWFYNTSDTYMFTYSDLMTLVLIRYLEKNDINFEQLEKDFVPSKDGGNSSSIFTYIFNLFSNDMTEIKAISENATFNVSNRPLNFRSIQEFLIGEFKKNDGFVHTETYEFLVPFWTNILGYVQNISNSSNVLADFLKEREVIALKKIFALLTSKTIAKSYKFDHRAYIVEKMIELQVLAINENDPSLSVD